MDFVKQQWTVFDTTTSTTTVIAEKSGADKMKVKSNLPRSLIGRLTAVASNNTLVLHNLQYNDTKLLFQSLVFIKFREAQDVSKVSLRPSVNLTVTGEVIAILFELTTI